jgi:hypothetical protein
MQIVVNARTVELGDTTSLTYARIVTLARLKGRPTVTYSSAEASGTLVFNETVELVDGMVFNVAHTESA